MADGDVLYAEVLWPRLRVWLLPIAFAASLGVAYGYAYGDATGWLVGCLTAALLLVAMVLGMRTRIEVDRGEVRAGRARLPIRFVGRVAALTPQEAFRARTAAADPRAYLVLRPWASAAAVILEVTDPQDPHPYWLVSTRRPDRLADALGRARDAARSG